MYVVIENTPGYLPEEDEPATFEDFRDAVRYMIELVRSNRDYRIEGGEDVTGWIDRENGCAYLTDEGRPHDLGRYFEVMESEEESGGITPEGQALGHRYVMGNVNAYCPKCSEEQGITVLDCDYDLDK